MAKAANGTQLSSLHRAAGQPHLGNFWPRGGPPPQVPLDDEGLDLAKRRSDGARDGTPSRLSERRPTPSIACRAHRRAWSRWSLWRPKSAASNRCCARFSGEAPARFLPTSRRWLDERSRSRALPERLCIEVRFRIAASRISCQERRFRCHWRATLSAANALMPPHRDQDQKEAQVHGGQLILEVICRLVRR